MPKSEGTYLYYAVQNGREGPRVYTSLSDFEKNTEGMTNVKYGRFNSPVLAQRYLAPALARAARLKAIRSASSNDVSKVEEPTLKVTVEECTHESDEELWASVMDVGADTTAEVRARVEEVVAVAVEETHTPDDDEDLWLSVMDVEVDIKTEVEAVVKEEVGVGLRAESSAYDSDEELWSSTTDVDFDIKEEFEAGVEEEAAVCVKEEEAVVCVKEEGAVVKEGSSVDVLDAAYLSPSPVNEPVKRGESALGDAPVYKEGHSWHCCRDPQGSKDESNVSNPVVLSDEQLHILDLVRQRKSVFVTGSAGTGKSVLMRAIIGLWPAGCRRLAITASTGAASIHFPGGRTIHSWAGIGLGAKDAELLWDDIKYERHKLLRWQHTDCIIIDEVSMIDDELFDKLDYIGRRARENSRPFGGIQLVICGDFFQLPPVVNSSKIKAKFAFESRAWNECFDQVHKLTHVFRQSDGEFVKMLEEVKIGKISAKTEAEFKYLARPVKYYDDIGPTELYPTNEEATIVNQMRLDCLEDREVTFRSYDAAGVDINDRKISGKRFREVLKSISAPEEVVLKKGARVMLIMNKLQGVLVNGSIGVVEDFCTIEEAEAYHVAPFHEDDKDAVQRAKDRLPIILRDRHSNWAGYRYPLVRFMNGRTLLCHPADFKQENRRGNLMACRTQVPLILAWALSIHKSQGATLERVKVDLSRVFERGQAYVALSRATSMDTLEVLNFDKSRVEAHPHVLQWMGYDADERDLEDENHRRAMAEEEFRRASEQPRDDEDYFAFVDDIDESDTLLLDIEEVVSS